MDRYIGKIMARSTTRGLREHSLKKELKPFSYLGRDVITSLHNEQTNEWMDKN